ncbi:XK-related protein 7 [Liparis tanakae]|uniref:XK-related protein n=1 Tax=Liparis tanakae TaxID=230148 RepID=A0A4Z2G0D2_9TELE|nr:XK-related protein 7 [Liparis tanakae]
MAAKSDGAAVSVEDDNTPRSLSEPGNPATRQRCGAAGGKPYTLLDCCWVLCALLVFFSDGATDLWLAADYHLRGHYWWFGLTLVFVVVPSAVVQVLSFRWFVYDYSDLSCGDGAASGSGTGAAAGAACGAATAGDHTLSTKDSNQRGESAAAVAAAAAAAGSAANATPVCTSSALSATAGTVAAPRRCCTVCMWVFQTVLHFLQLGQVWRDVCTEISKTAADNTANRESRLTVSPCGQSN